MNERPIDKVLSRLEGVQSSGRGFESLCPAHDDNSPSLSITEGDDGRVLLNCHAGCSPEAVTAALGLALADLFLPKMSAEASSYRSSIAVTYDYFDAEGVLLFQTVRLSPKDFRQRRPNKDSSRSSGGWTWNLRGIETVLYRLPNVLEAVAGGRVIYLTEGEKDADRLAALGFASTCNPMGAGKWKGAYAETLRGARVIVLPDNDSTGRKHAHAVACSLVGIASEVRIVHLPGLPEKGDVSDWLDAGGTPETLEALVRETPVFDTEAQAPEESRADFEDALPIGTLVGDVEREVVRWLWPGRLALGKITILDGDPGLGKSTLYCDLAARLTRGTEWPDGASIVETAGVVIVTTEDGIGDTIRPRLEEAGADVHRVSVVQLIPETEGPGRVPVLPHDVERLMRECRRVGARLLVIDPLMAHLGSDTNSYRDQDVRRALAPLSEAAERFGVAVLVLRHLNKATGGSALYRGGGSIGIIGAARVGLLAGRDPADETLVVLACSKNNIAARPDSLAFRLVSSERDPGTAVLRWEGTSPLSAEDLCRPAPSGSPARDEAQEWLEAELEAGPRPAADLYRAAEAAGISEATLKRAKNRLGIKPERVGRIGGGGYWQWELPEGERANLAKSAKVLTPGDEHLSTLSGPPSGEGWRSGALSDPWESESELGEGL